MSVVFDWAALLKAADSATALRVANEYVALAASAGLHARVERLDLGTSPPEVTLLDIGAVPPATLELLVRRYVLPDELEPQPGHLTPPRAGAVSTPGLFAPNAFGGGGGGRGGGRDARALKVHELARDPLTCLVRVAVVYAGEAEVELKGRVDQEMLQTDTFRCCVSRVALSCVVQVVHAGGTVYVTVESGGGSGAAASPIKSLVVTVAPDDAQHMRGTDRLSSLITSIIQGQVMKQVVWPNWVVVPVKKM